MKVELVIFTTTLTFDYSDQGHASADVAAGQMSAGPVTAGFMTTLQILQLVSARWRAHTHTAESHALTFRDLESVCACLSMFVLQAIWNDQLKAN